MPWAITTAGYGRGPSGTYSHASMSSPETVGIRTVVRAIGERRAAAEVSPLLNITSGFWFGILCSLGLHLDSEPRQSVRHRPTAVECAPAASRLPARDRDRRSTRDTGAPSAPVRAVRQTTGAARRAPRGSSILHFCSAAPRSSTQIAAPALA